MEIIEYLEEAKKLTPKDYSIEKFYNHMLKILSEFEHSD